VTPAGRLGTVVFDLGGVLADWDPRYLYRRLFDGDEERVEHFLTQVATPEWNHAMDAGRPQAEAVAELVAVHPEHEPAIRAWVDRWDEMLGEEIAGTAAIVEELAAAGVRLLALTNWSAETFPPQRSRFPFLSWFDGIVVSGEEGVIKPDPMIFRILLDRYRIGPDEAVFIDDNPANAAAAEALGIHGIHFRSPPLLRRELEALGLL
jgi:2-haloacid dehalogenase